MSSRGSPYARRLSLDQGHGAVCAAAWWARRSRACSLAPAGEWMVLCMWRRAARGAVIGGAFVHGATACTSRVQVV